MLLPRKSQGRAVQRLVTSWALDTTHEQGPPVIQLCPPRRISRPLSCLISWSRMGNPGSSHECAHPVQAKGICLSWWSPFTPGAPLPLHAAFLHISGANLCHRLLPRPKPARSVGDHGCLTETLAWKGGGQVIQAKPGPSQ